MQFECHDLYSMTGMFVEGELGLKFHQTVALSHLTLCIYNFINIRLLANPNLAWKKANDSVQHVSTKS
jgi:hypothetical protein